MVQTAWYLVGGIYAGLASFVFFRAVGGTSGPLGLGQRLQNLFFGIALLGACGAALVAIPLRGTRAFATEELRSALVEPLAAVEFVTFAVIVVGIVLGIFSYYTQSKSDRFLERFSSFLELVGDFTEELSTAPIGKEGLNFPYFVMHQAAGEEFLDFSPTDKLRMDNAFCARVVWEYRVGRQGRIGRRRLSNLAEAYDAELGEPVLRQGLSGGVCGQALPNTLTDLISEWSGSGGRSHGLGDALALALDINNVSNDGHGEPASLPEWGQLVYLALAEARLLPARLGVAILEGRGVSQRVLTAVFAKVEPASQERITSVCELLRMVGCFGGDQC